MACHRTAFCLLRCTATDIGLQINFVGEDGVDAGGVFREGMSSMVEDLFSADLDLLIQCPNGRHAVGQVILHFIRCSSGVATKYEYYRTAVARLDAWLYSEGTSPVVILILKSSPTAYIILREDDKRGYTPIALTKTGILIFTAGEVFDIHVVVGIHPTAQHAICAATVHYSSYIRHHCCLRTAQGPTPCGTSTLLFEKPNVRTGNICAPRACVLCKSVAVRCFWFLFFR